MILHLFNNMVELMFTHTKNAVENHNSVAIPQNFTSANDELDCSSSPRASNDTTKKSSSFAYVLVSIMSKLFQDEHTLHQIIINTHRSYPSDTHPIVYICADTLQEITKPYLFPSNSESTRNPVDREREKWKKKYDNFYEKQENTPLKKDIVMWDTLKSVPVYLQIRNFTDAVLCSKNHTENFPDLDEHLLNDFNKDIENISTLLLENINIISESFSSKNLQKIKRKADAEKKEKEKLQKKLGTVLRTDLLVNETNPDTELSKITQGLKDATPIYLSEEFSVFILINYLNNLELIKSHLRLEIFDENIAKIFPKLIYPISSSGQQAELTFSTFSMIETLYIKYCERLSLPIISTPLAVTDVKINTHLNERSLKLVDDNTEKKENNDDQKIESSSTESNSSNESESRRKELTTYSTWSTMYPPDNKPAANEADKITNKIIKLISRHKRTREESVEIRKNNIACTIKVNEKRQATDETPIEESTQLQDLRDIIYDAVISTWEDGLEETRNFVYAGYSFTLETKRSTIEHDYIRKPSIFAYK